ncbi:MAG TPA: NADH-quinone oxidoreductase subunit A [Bdellovibrionota bacterium]|nr:NADH-quinone oxidoreductase subunit A [Bdellovibrionota bacterium]
MIQIFESLHKPLRLFMFSDYLHVLFMLIIGAVFVPVTLFVGKLIRPHRPSLEKNTTYECGEEPQGSAWVQFNLRFYTLAILFIIFEVEIALIFPVITIFKDKVHESLGLGFLTFIEIFFFIGILMLGLIYAWVKKDLDWIRKLSKG